MPIAWVTPVSIVILTLGAGTRFGPVRSEDIAELGAIKSKKGSANVAVAEPKLGRGARATRRAGVYLYNITELIGTRSSHKGIGNGRLRDELLNETLFSSLPQARTALANWRTDYNTARPHSQLGWQTPTAFASTFTPRRALAPRYATSAAPEPVAAPAPRGSKTAGNELTAG